jgi:hypothetical protein
VSDGVFAIARTVLMLDLRAPSHRQERLLNARIEQWPAYVAFLASFLFVGVTWTNHHATFREIESTDRSVTWANLGILCGTVLLAFPTAVLADAFRDATGADEQTAAISTPYWRSACRSGGSSCSCCSTAGDIPARATGSSPRGARRCAGPFSARWASHAARLSD